jgi:VCBS repeat-containing protein
MKKKQMLIMALCFGMIILLNSCKNEPPINPCDTTNLTASATKTDATGNTNNGSITVSASGGDGINYTIGTNTNTTGQFNNLSAGTYTITVKNTQGCNKTISVTINSSTPGNPCTGTVQAGPNFTNVKNIIKATCGGSNCHLNGKSSAGYNFDTDCNIETYWSQIHNATVVNQTMPPSGLSPSQMDQITAWVNAGHKYTD